MLMKMAKLSFKKVFYDNVLSLKKDIIDGEYQRDTLICLFLYLM